ncbi:MAG TPA: serine hydrolase domain-containing protein [Thermoanaerobaculia bacterium]|nr:serine hydrolase domain-containing protein [Thermoanaerobaculia bacterium]
MIRRVSILLSLLVCFAATAAPAEQADIRALLDRSYKADEPGAVVLAVRNGEVIVREARGLADLELRTPLRSDMLLKLGSITKQFTAAAILKLAADNKLALTDPLSKYLSGFPDALTIEQLLTHTGGVVEYTPLPEYRTNLRQEITTDEMVALIRAQPLEFTPGTQFKYTNSAYFLLGAAIEKITGESFSAYLKRAVLEPAGLTSTRMDSLTEIIPNRVRGYDRDAGVLRHATLYSPSRAYAVGGLLSTVDDLRRWNEQAIANPQLARAFTAHKLPDGKSTGYGLGWFVNELEGARVIEHGGDIPGFTAHVLHIPEKKVFVALLSNDAQHVPRPDFIATKIALVLLGAKYEPTAISLGADALDRVVGTYKSASGTERRVFREGTKLFIERVGGRKSEVLPSSATTFYYPETFLSVELQGDVLILRNRNTEIDRATRVTSSKDQ